MTHSPDLERDNRADQAAIDGLEARITALGEAITRGTAPADAIGQIQAAQAAMAEKQNAIEGRKGVIRVLQKARAKQADEARAAADATRRAQGVEMATELLANALQEAELTADLVAGLAASATRQGEILDRLMRDVVGAIPDDRAREAIAGMLQNLWPIHTQHLLRFITITYEGWGPFAPLIARERPEMRPRVEQLLARIRASLTPPETPETPAAG